MLRTSAMTDARVLDSIAREMGEQLGCQDVLAILAAASAGELKGLVVGGVDPHDLADPRLAEEALDNVGFLVSLELRLSSVSRRADVVLPVAPAVEKSGSYLNWGAAHLGDDRCPRARLDRARDG
ncbi:hypothetical protein GCM10009557_29430 [Virgisporangium ochraceum]